MALSDPFNTTAALAQERSQGIERGIGTLASGAMQAAQGIQTQNMLKQMGIIADNPLTSADYEKEAKKHFGKNLEFNVSSDMTEQEKTSIAKQMFDSLGIPPPKPSGTTFNYDKFAELGSKLGMQYAPSPFGGSLSMAPKKPELTPEEVAIRYKQAQDAITKTNLPEGTQATISPRGGTTIKAPSSTTEKANINKERASKILEGIKSNSKSFVPDLVTGFGNPDLRAEIQTQAIEKGINLQDPILQWKGAVRLATSLNGPQQIRLQQVLSYADKSIPQMRELSNVFKRFDFTPANEVELKAAMTSTAVSPELRDAATKFMVQYTTMRTDLAQVFSGGYAPTEDSFKLADQSLSKLWGAGQMNAGLDQLQIDLGFKRAALEEVQQTSPTGMSSGMGGQVTQAAGLTGGLKQIKSDDDYNSLPSGSEFIGPDGQRRRKP